MRILLVFSAKALESRGTPSRVRNLAAALAMWESEVRVISADDEASFLQETGLPHRSCPAGDPGHALAQDLKEYAPDVVYGHTHKALPFLGRIPLSSSVIRVADLHGDLARERLEDRRLSVPRRLFGAVREWRREATWLPRMDGCTAVTSALAGRCARFRVPARVVWGGVNPDCFEARGETSTSDSLRVGYAGSFYRYQGVHVLVEAMGKLLESGIAAELTLIGEAAAAPALVRRARHLLGERLRLLGPVSYDQIPALLSQQDVLAVPRPESRTARFGFPSKLTEYLALGKAVVATDVGEQGRLVRHLETGYLVPPGDSVALARALADLRDSSLRQRLGAAGRRLVVRELDWRVLGRRVLDFFFELSRERSAA